MIKKRDNHRMVLGRFLLTGYLMLMLVGILHVHKAQPEYQCKNCHEHIHHEGFAYQWAINHDGCLVCQFFHQLFVSPQAFAFSAVVLAVVAFIPFASDVIVCSRVCLPGLRAPPVYS